ncbi:MAG TPA: MFS transporter [Candidatus Lokiarchaeia archaeon]|nr:MFS transporter [Candidatus Lokiarchaeia archaeon]
MSIENEEQSDAIEQKPQPGSTLTQVVMNSANIIDNADGQLFPTVYNQVQIDFKNNGVTVGLDQLGWITTIRSLLQAVTTPIWGWWNDRHSRKKVLAFGCLLWGIFTILMATALNFVELLLYRAVTGVGLAVIIPTTQSIVADLVPPAKRGKAFGWLAFTQVLGVIIGTIFATILVTGVPSNWRLIFVIWGFVSIAIAAVVMLFAKDPIRGGSDPKLAPRQTTGANGEEPKIQRKAFKEILTNRTFMSIVAQGVIGSLPWNAILFMVAWFEYIGFDDTTAGFMFLIIAVGAALGNFFGGVFGDLAAKKNPKYGRIVTAQISAVIGIPLAWIIFLVIPWDTSSIFLYIIVGAITGFLISWPSAACNNPIFSELFEPEIRGTMFSIDRVFEGSLAALGTIFVAWIADALGFINPPAGLTDIWTWDPLNRAINTSALAWGMFYTTVIPWIISTSLYTLVYFFYPKDLQRIQQILKARVLGNANT